MYHDYHAKDPHFDVHAGMPVTKASVENHPRALERLEANGRPLRVGVLAGGRTLVATYVGPYDNLPRAWICVREHLQEQRLVPRVVPGGSCEERKQALELVRHGS